MTRELPTKSTRPGSWVQTDRAAHEAWGRLSIQSPKAGALLHVLAAQVGDHNAVVISQRVLAKILGCHVNTVATAVKTLVAGNWLEVRQIGPSSTVNAYVLNDRVAWATSREGLRHSLFSAAVVVSEEEQPDRAEIGTQPPLRRLPRLFPGERQLPTGPGEDPPSQPFLDSLEPDLPTRQLDIEEFTT